VLFRSPSGAVDGDPEIDHSTLAGLAPDGRSWSDGLAGFVDGRWTRHASQLTPSIA
jgi:hypothetical protein